MIAVIAGTGSLPIEACRSLAQQQQPFFVISLSYEDNGIAFQQFSNVTIVTVDVYQVSALLKILKKHNASHVLFIGKVDKQKILARMRIDWLGIKLLTTSIHQGDKAVLETVTQFLAQHQIMVISQQDVLSNLHVAPGIIAGTLTPALEADITFGMDIATQMAAHDIGQTVVVKDKTVLAIEAIEGTDACIARGVALGKGNVVVCKSAHPQHNAKFDLPTLGAHSLRGLNPGDVAACAWKASMTFIAERETFVRRAQELGITLYAT